MKNNEAYLIQWGQGTSAPCGTWSLDEQFTYADFFTMNTGSGREEKIGRAIKPIKLTVDGTIRSTMFTAATAADFNKPLFARVTFMLVKVWSTVTDPDPAHFIPTGMFLNMHHPSTSQFVRKKDSSYSHPYKVLKKKTIVMKVPITNDDESDPLVPAPQNLNMRYKDVMRDFKMTYRFSEREVIQYETDISSHPKNWNLFFYIGCDSNSEYITSGSTEINFFHYKMLFTDN